MDFAHSAIIRPFRACSAKGPEGVECYPDQIGTTMDYASSIPILIMPLQGLFGEGTKGVEYYPDQICSRMYYQCSIPILITPLQGLLLLLSLGGLRPPLLYYAPSGLRSPTPLEYFALSGLVRRGYKGAECYASYGVLK